ncbi:MAG TPA: dTDP-4-dehydrorhamnose 3,5-epimerase [Candidatus Eisenbacteria bacterium]|nr:dTDP-4-dehydrorhamnose 3,5-epimerase [Candidatus Eisenbacteria bacterium]
MRIHRTDLAEVIVLEPEVFADNRGHFLETYNERSFAAAGITARFVQDNQSFSKQGVLRGLHYQLNHPQGKLIRVLQGEIYDVAVDIRTGQPTFGKWAGIYLKSTDQRTVWIPEGFAHGFYTLSELAQVAYKVTAFYEPQNDRSLLWNDPDVGVRWPLLGEPILSPKDRSGRSLKELYSP